MSALVGLTVLHSSKKFSFRFLEGVDIGTRIISDFAIMLHLICI